MTEEQDEIDMMVKAFKSIRSNDDLEDFLSGSWMSDNINSPAYYQSGSGLEVIDVIEAFDLNYNLGNVIKYVLRCRKKGCLLEDLKKACYYLRREITQVEQGDEDDD